MPAYRASFKPLTWLLTAALMTSAIANLRWQNAGVGLTLGVGYLLWSGWICGRWIAPGQPRRWQMLYGMLGHLALLTVAAAAFYWWYRLSTPIIAGLLIALPLIWLTLPKPTGQEPPLPWQRNPLRGQRRTMGVTSLLVAAFLGLTLHLVFLLVRGATAEALRTPWQALPPHFFLEYLAATLAILALNLRTDRAGRRLPLTLIHLGLSVSVALLFYPLGYGFDPIIHQATERVIATAGIITPKPPYYIGQYVLVVALSRLLGISVTLVDRLLGPIGFLLAAAVAYSPWRRGNPTAAMVPLLLLLLPYGTFAATTPQATANLWLLLTAWSVTLHQLKARAWPRVRWLSLSLLTSAAAAVTHPIAGVPALALVGFAWLHRGNWKPRRWANWPRRIALGAAALATTAALPVFFLAYGRTQGFAAADLWQGGHLAERIKPTLAALLPALPNRLSPLLDFAYGVDRSRLWIIGLIGAVGVAHLARRRRSNAALPPLLTGLCMLASFAILRLWFTFPQLAGSEQLVFPSRALEMTQLAWLPLLLIGGVTVIDRCRREPVLRLCLLAVFASVVTATFYLAYPRVDRYHVDRGYNVTAADIAAVRLVAADARGDYLVLANQMTSAAAVHEFGFSPTYPASDIPGRRYYAYPIPTSQPLYRQYLAMVNQTPSRQAAQRAAALVAAEIHSVYFILDRYWDNFEVIASTAKKNADRWWSVDGGRALVFRYDVNFPPP